MTLLFLESSSDNSDDWIILVMLAQFFVGIVQLLGAVFRTFFSLIEGKSLKLLGYYWIIVALYFVILYVFTLYFSKALFYWVPLAWLIAIWYNIRIVFNKKSYLK